MPLVNPIHQDAALTSLQNSLEQIWLCPNDPADYATANTTKLVAITLSPGDFSLMNGDIDGRKLHYNGNTGIANAAGTVTRAVFVNVTNTTIEFVNNITSTAVASGGQVTVNPFDIWEVGNPT